MSNTAIDTQSKTATLAAVIERSADAATTGESLSGALSGYEAQFTAVVAAWATAVAAGNKEADIRKALQADQKASGTRHFAASNDSGQAMDLLAKFYVLDGDLPTEGATKWVYRPASTGATGLLEGESSVSAVITSVRAPKGKADLKALGHGSEYGKAVCDKILAEASDKVDALVRLQQHARYLDKIVKDAKAAEHGPKTADKYLKSASGPLNKVSEALDAGLIEDADAVRALIADLISVLDTAKAHGALAVAVGVGTADAE